MSRAQRLQLLLVLACAAGAAALAASEFMDTFELTSPGGEATQSSEASDRHNYALLVLAAFALGALVVALLAGSQVAYFAVAVAGVVALLIFLIGDLPDVNKIGPLDNAREPFVDAQAEPQAGFWLELGGALLLAVGGVGLATRRAPEPRERLAEPGGAEPPAASPPIGQQPAADRAAGVRRP